MIRFITICTSSVPGGSGSLLCLPGTDSFRAIARLTLIILSSGDVAGFFILPELSESLTCVSDSSELSSKA